MNKVILHFLLLAIFILSTATAFAQSEVDDSEPPFIHKLFNGRKHKEYDIRREREYSALKKRNEELADKFSDLRSEKAACEARNTELSVTIKDCRNRNDKIVKEISTRQDNISNAQVNINSSLDAIMIATNGLGGKVDSSRLELAALKEAIRKRDSMNDELQSNFRKEIGDESNDITVHIVKGGIIFVDISDNLLFESGKYEITLKAMDVLKKIAKVLQEHPLIKFEVQGNTDSIEYHQGCYLDNWDLSVKRATSVVRVLHDQFDISWTRMTAAGNGQFSPVASNETVEGRRRNRRTSIVILPDINEFANLFSRN